jgi:recombination protein RecR
VAYPAPLEDLVRAFERFPGIGRRTAERLALHVLRDEPARELGPAIERAVRDTRRCRVCGNLDEAELCRLCADEERDATVVLVVEEPRDVEAVERAGCYAGRYHVLMGAYNPAAGVEPEHLGLPRLVERLRAEGVAELILGTDPDREGEATALLILETLERAGLDLRVTRLARGLPAGSALEYLHRGVLEDALEGRVTLRAGR